MSGDPYGAACDVGPRGRGLEGSFSDVFGRFCWHRFFWGGSWWFLDFLGLSFMVFGRVVSELCCVRNWILRDSPHREANKPWENYFLMAQQLGWFGVPAAYRSGLQSMGSLWIFSASVRGLEFGGHPLRVGELNLATVPGGSPSHHGLSPTIGLGWLRKPSMCILVHICPYLHAHEDTISCVQVFGEGKDVLLPAALRVLSRWSCWIKCRQWSCWCSFG